MAAVSVFGIGFGALMSLNSHQLQLVRSSHESNNATLCLEERVEQMRIANWKQLIDPNYLRANFYSTAVKSGAVLDQLHEKITVNAYPDHSVATPIMVERVGGQAPFISSLGTNIASQPFVRVDLYATWKAQDGRVRTRQACMLVSNGGINRLTLPAFGSAASGTTSGSWPGDPVVFGPSAGDGGTTDGGGTTGDGSTTGDGGSTGGTTTPGNGNGNGRGTIGGKPGKK
jgi:hypothetical protein